MKYKILRVFLIGKGEGGQKAAERNFEVPFLLNHDFETSQAGFKQSYWSWLCSKYIMQNIGE